jgi:crotonobetainyl-CoA:carnitine CoA-transferase CaiB-like acyl-CoA transferase
MQFFQPLKSLRVLCLSNTLPGLYATKVLIDGGAQAIVVEPEGGHPLRRTERRSGDSNPLFAYLVAGCDSLELKPMESVQESLAAAISSTDVVICDEKWFGLGSGRAPAQLLEQNPTATVLSISDWGLTVGSAGRPASDLTLQAASGSMARRGDARRPPIAIGGGRVTEWIAGSYGALSVLLSRYQSEQSGRGELIDLSRFESVIHGTMVWPDVSWPVDPKDPTRIDRSDIFPSNVPCKDGVVGVTSLTGQQWESFALMVEHPEWLSDESLYLVMNRTKRRDELDAAVTEWGAAKTVEEVTDLAVAFRIPVVPVASAATVTEIDHFVARRSFQPNPTGFVQPTPPYIVEGFEHAVVGQVPSVDRGGSERVAAWSVHRDATAAASLRFYRPLAGLRVVDFTQFYAASMVGNILANLGAEVIHIESPSRLDNFRMNAPERTIGADSWWETSVAFYQPNTAKRSLTLDLDKAAGREVALRLIGTTDVVSDGFSPRVMENWGLTYDRLTEVCPDLIMLRMSAFGSWGPWRERTGFSPTIEQATGWAWISGYADRLPQPPINLADPIAGVHAAIALMLALYERSATGKGALIDSPMIGGNLSIAAEQVITYQVHGVLQNRDGNRSGSACPSGVFAAGLDGESWLAVAVENDEHWTALANVIPALSEAGAGDMTTDQRRARQDWIEAILGGWLATQSVKVSAEKLRSAGVPSEEVVLNNDCVDPQLELREFVESIEHPVRGRYRQIGWPAKFCNRIGPWHLRHAPLLGADNSTLLTTLGYSQEEIADLEASGVIASAPTYG